MTENAADDDYDDADDDADADAAAAADVAMQDRGCSSRGRCCSTARRVSYQISIVQ